MGSDESKGYLIVGLGSMGRRRTRVLRALLPNVNLYGVDGRQDRRQEWSRNYEGESYECIEAAISAHDICAVFVCTSPESHASIIKYCLMKNLNVFSEINLLADMYKENILLAKEKKRVLFLSSTPMYKKEIEVIKKTVCSSKKNVFYQYHVGQYLPDWHPWEKFNDFFVGKKETNGCREIFAIEMPWILDTFGEITEYHLIADNITNLNINFPDGYLMLVKHENGNSGIIGFDVACRHAIRRFEAYSEDIYIEWHGKPENLIVRNTETGELEYPCKQELYDAIEGYSELINEQAYIEEVKSFFNVMEKKEEARYSFDKDYLLLKMLDELGI